MTQPYRYTRERAAAISAYVEALPKSVGATQRKVLYYLVDQGSWHLGCGWKWSTHVVTVRLLEGLVKRGLVTRTEGKQEYFPAVQFDEAGKQISREAAKV